MKHPLTIIAIIATGLLIELSQLAAIPPTRHTCNFKLCPMQGEAIFSGCHDCNEGDDCYQLDRAHWDNPAWTYDQCDSAVFTIQPNN